MHKPYKHLKTRAKTPKNALKNWKITNKTSGNTPSVKNF